MSEPGNAPRDLLPGKPPHPVVWTILYLPFGALSGFVTVALTFLATKQGLSISEGALLNGAQMLTQWLKWTWAPVVDITLGPKRWYVLSTALSGISILAMASVPLSRDSLPLLLGIIAAASLVNSAVGMAVEAIIAHTTPAEQIGRVSAWFQAGNLGGVGFGGALGLYLVVHLPAPWMAGVVMAVLFLLCCTPLFFVPAVPAHHRGAGPLAAVKGVVGDLRTMLKTKGGLAAAILCVMPVGCGAAQAVLTQAEVAKKWGAGEREVALLQGLAAGFVTAVGCFAGGALCQRVKPRTAYVGIGLALCATALGMAASPMSITTYVVWSLVYTFVVGLAYAAFTAFALEAMGKGSGATKYNIFASLSNFPIWWLGLVLGVAAQRWGARSMLVTEAALGAVGVVVFLFAQRRVLRSRLPATL